MADNDDTMTKSAVCIRETAKAILVKLPNHEEVWVPKSVIHDDSEVYEAGNEGKLIVKRWWAEREEWEDDDDED